METVPVVLGLNHSTAPVEVRKLFWVRESRRSTGLEQLSGAPGIEEVEVLSTCHCLGFILWANNAPAAANTIFDFL